MKLLKLSPRTFFENIKTKQTFSFMLLILLITFIIYIPVLTADFTNWDDPFHLHDNHNIQQLTPKNIARIFLSTVLLVYIPLTMFSFAIEHHFFGFNPFIYHLDNLLLHLLTTFLVFQFCSKLGFSKKISLWMCLIFGIHPMHVESVAWVTERKDVLYGAFYMLSLIHYWYFLTQRQKIYYASSWFFGLLSILAKPMAISLPLTLLLLHWLYEPKKMIKPIFLIIPFVFYIFPILTISHGPNMGTFAVNNSLFDAVLICIWTFSFYIYTFIFPVKLNPFWVTPEPISLINPIYFSSLIILISI